MKITWGVFALTSIVLSSCFAFPNIDLRTLFTAFAALAYLYIA